MKSDLGSLAEMCSEGDGHMIMTKPDVFTRHLKTYVKCVCDCLVVDTLALTAASSSSQQYLQTVEAIFSQIYSQGVLLSADSQLHQLLLYPCDILPQYLEALTELESFVRSSDCDRAQASAMIDKSRACVASARAFCESEQCKMTATRDFWDREGAAFVGLKAPSRRLILDSMTTPGLGLAHASSFSKHRFVLFRYLHQEMKYSHEVLHLLRP